MNAENEKIAKTTQEQGDELHTRSARINFKHPASISIVCGVISILGFITTFIKSLPAIIILIPFISMPVGILCGIKALKSDIKSAAIIGMCLNVLYVVLMIGVVMKRLFI